MKLGSIIKRIFIDENATLDEASFLSKLALKLEFAENHGLYKLNQDKEYQGKKRGSV
jgi:hypothetical protein